MGRSDSPSTCENLSGSVSRALKTNKSTSSRVMAQRVGLAKASAQVERAKGVFSDSIAKLNKFPD
jgi:hypothetical protein